MFVGQSDDLRLYCAAVFVPSLAARPLMAKRRLHERSSIDAMIGPQVDIRVSG